MARSERQIENIGPSPPTNKQFRNPLSDVPSGFDACAAQDQGPFSLFNVISHVLPRGESETGWMEGEG